MDLDAKVCYCFHVTKRKLLNFLRIEKPRVASQLSACGGAGTGCGWCIPFLKQLFAQETGGPASELAQLTPAEYERRRDAVAGQRLSPRLPACGVSGRVIDGEDADAVRELAVIHRVREPGQQSF